MGNLMKGRRGVIMGVANNRSIAWGIAQALHAEGAEIALTYQPPAMDRRVQPLAESIGCDFLIPCDVSLECDDDNPAALERAFEAIGDHWESIDFIVHAIAFSDRSELSGRYADTTRGNFVKTMQVSCFSFTEIMQRAARLMPKGGAALTLTYIGASRAMPNYNVMGIAKAALESSVRYLAVDFGKDAIRVNAISAGPIKTLAASGIAKGRSMYHFQKRGSPLRRPVNTAEIAGAAVYLLSDMSSGVTGEVHFVDSGFNIIAMPPDDL